jgi:hypothetical protein
MGEPDSVKIRNGFWGRNGVRGGEVNLTGTYQWEVRSVRTRLAKNSLLLAVVMLGLSSVIPAFAQEDGTRETAAADTAAGATESAEAMVVTYAWFWKDQQQQKITNPTDGSDAATLELKNPYCPDTSPAGSPPEQACKQGRLPVEVRDNYKEPHKLSAVNFDLSLVPTGSKIKKFEVRLWEAQDEISRSTQYNVDGKKIRACEIDGVFGEGEARLYKEVPKYDCTKLDATAKRSSTEIGKGEDAKEAFFWDLDLTAQAKEWAAKDEFFTSVMLTPVAPKGEAAAEDRAWQVVFAGPLETKYGIDTKVVYDPPKIEPPVVPTIPPVDPTDPADPADPADPLDPGATDFGSSPTTTTTTTSGDAGSAPTSSDAGTADPNAGGDEPAAEDPTLAAEDAELASDEETAPSGMPLYMWLAILAGMLGFTMVRSVVLEKNTGIRPDGVLAQIQRLNAQRRGATAVGASSGNSAFAGLAAGLGAIGSKVTAGAGKLAQLVSRKKG